MSDEVLHTRPNRPPLYTAWESVSHECGRAPHDDRMIGDASLNERSGSADADRDRPLVATDDAELLDDLLRLCVAADVEPRVVTTKWALQASWNRYRLVIVGEDLADELSEGHVPKRGRVIVASRTPEISSRAWDLAVHIGADQVVFLPQSEAWLVDRLAAVDTREASKALIIGFVGGSGGVGASTLAAATAQLADETVGHTVAIDLDQLGAGLSVLLGDDLEPGLGWPEFAAARGRIRSRGLVASLASCGSVRCVSGGADALASIPSGVVGSVIDALTESVDVICVDVPRLPNDGIAEALCRMDLLVIVVRCSTPSILATRRLLERMSALEVPTALVAVDPSSTIDEVDLESALECRPFATLRHESSVPKLIERGQPLVTRRGALRRVSSDIIDHTKKLVDDRVGGVR